MLVLVSFVLVLAAAVTLVVGLLQSGLTLIYLSIGCSVLAGVVLAVAVLRGRPEPKPAAAGRSFAPPPRAEPTQVPATVGAPSSGAETTGGWSAPTPPPPPSPSPRAPAGDDAGTKAAGTALLSRLRGRRAESEGTGPPDEPVAGATEAAPVAADETTEMAVVGAPAEPSGEFPLADYDRLRATEVLSQLPSLDRNQLQAVREREASGKNRFTVMNRIDALLASKQEPAWEVAEDEWEPGVGTDAESEAAVIEADALRAEDDFGAAADGAEWETAGEVEDDEVDELVSPGQDFPIAGYESLTVGQILPRLTELDADQLAQVRAREQQGRARGTILDRIDRLATKAGRGARPIAMPAAAPTAPTTRKPSSSRKAAAVSKTRAPAVKKTTRVAKTPATAPVKKRAPARKAAAVPAPPAPPARKAPSRKAAAPAARQPRASTPPAKGAVKKARATKKRT